MVEGSTVQHIVRSINWNGSRDAEATAYCGTDGPPVWVESADDLCQNCLDAVLDAADDGDRTAQATVEAFDLDEPDEDTEDDEDGDAGE